MIYVFILLLVLYWNRMASLAAALKRKKVLLEGRITHKKIEGEYSGFQTYKISIGNTAFKVLPKQYDESEIGQYARVILLNDSMDMSDEKKEVLSFNTFDASELEY